MSEAYAWLENSLETIKRAHWYRTPYNLTQPPGAIITLGGQSLVNFASNDYLGLATHPALKAAACAAIEQWGTGSTGSRLLSGQRPLHQHLETTIAQWKGTEAALAFSSGYLANVGTIAALVGKRDLILADEYNHSSLQRGSALSGATVLTYQHRQIENLQTWLAQQRMQFRRCLIVTDGVFSMDGDLCPLPQLLTIAEQYSAMLLVDDAHGSGVLGASGAGCGEHFAVNNQPWIQVGTLSKALGSLGGYVAGSSGLIDFLRNRAPTWIYTTGLSPADTAAALAGIQQIHQEPERLHRLRQNINHLYQGLCSLPHTETWIVPTTPPEPAILWLKVSSPMVALQLAQQLQDRGYFVPAIRPPTVPTSRLRFSVMATHTSEQISGLIQGLTQMAQQDFSG